MKARQFRLLLVDDTPEDREYVKHLLTQDAGRSYTFDETGALSAAMKSIRQNPPDCILLDYNLPDGEGVRLLDKIREEFGESAFPVVMLTASGNTPVAVDALKRGALDYIEKDQLQQELLVRTLRHAVERNNWKKAAAEAERQLRDSYERMQLTLTAAGVGTCDWNLVTAQMQWDSHCERLFGLVPGSFRGTVDAFFRLVHTDDRARIEQSLQTALTEREIPVLEFRCIWPNGSIRWISLNGKIYRDSANTPMRLLGVMQDVTAKRRSEADLRRQAQVIDQVHEAVVFTDLKGQIVGWNGGAERVFGYSAEEAIGQDIGFLYFEEEAAAVRERILHPSEERGQREMELRIRRKDGSQCWILLSLSLLRDESGQPYRVVGYSHDITARRKAEQALRDSLHQTRVITAAINQAEDVVLITEAEPIDQPGPRILYVNEAFEALTGYTSAEVIGQSPRFLQGPGTDRAALDTIRASLKVFEPCRVELLNYRKDGHAYWSDLSIVPVADETGWFTHWVAVQRDVTAQKEAIQALRSSEARFRQLAEAMPQLVWVATTAGENVWTNSRWLNYTGATHEEVRGEKWDSTIHPDDLTRMRQSWKASITTGEPFEFEHRLRSSSGEYRWFVARALPIRDSFGVIREWFGTSTDIDDRKRMEQELQRSNQDLERFAFIASHDLQEPLRMVSIYAQLLGRKYKDQLGTDADEMIAAMLDGSQRMSRLIRDLLAYARAGQEEPRIPTSLSEALTHALANLRALIQESHAQVTYESLPVVMAHPGRLAQVLQNLVGNAVKYREPGRTPEVHISAAQIEDYCVISVRDNGTGFPSDMAKAVFEPFRRLTVGPQAGTGLGLAICQRMVEGWGGSIWAESEPGIGSVFHVRLQLAETRGETASAS